LQEEPGKSSINAKGEFTNDKVLLSNRKRARAYELEQEALQILNDKVIYAV